MHIVRSGCCFRSVFRWQRGLPRRLSAVANPLLNARSGQPSAVQEVAWLEPGKEPSFLLAAPTLTAAAWEVEQVAEPWDGRPSHAC